MLSDFNDSHKKTLENTVVEYIQDILFRNDDLKQFSCETCCFESITFRVSIGRHYTNCHCGM